MSSELIVKYSPLCDTDKLVYNQYLATCRQLFNGQYLGQVGGGGGAWRIQGHCCGSVDVGGRVDGTVVTAGCQEWDTEMVLRDRLCVSSGQCGVDCVRDAGERAVGAASGRLAGCDAGGSGGVLSGGVFVESGEGAGSDTRDRDGSLGPLGGEVAGGLRGVASGHFGVAFVIPSGEGKTRLARSYPGLFVDHDGCVDSERLAGLRAAGDWGAVNEYLRSVEIDAARVLLTWSRETVPSGWNLLGELALRIPTGVRSNVSNRSALVNPVFFASFSQRDHHMAGLLARSGYTVGKFGVADGVVYGPNYERNVRAREQKKQRKRRRRIDGDWRARKGDAVVATEPVPDKVTVGPVVGRAGFFSECDAGVRKELRDTRAQLLIVENKRRVAEEEAKLKRCLSPHSLVRELIQVTAMATRLKNQTKDQAIGGWAATVVDHLAKSVAESAPSSVPSLESVGYNDSVSQNGASDAKSLRRAEYDGLLVALEARYDSMEAYSIEEYDCAVMDLKDQYADVVYSADELVDRFYSKKFARAMCGAGLGFDKIEEVLGCARNIEVV